MDQAYLVMWRTSSPVSFHCEYAINKKQALLLARKLTKTNCDHIELYEPMKGRIKPYIALRERKQIS